MKNFVEQMGITGHLTVSKAYADGAEEIVYDDSNMIVSGMGESLSYLFTASGSDSITDYQIESFQIGVGGEGREVVSGINELTDPLESIVEYGEGSNLFLEEREQLINGVPISGKIFAQIATSRITRVGDSSVRYTLVVDEEAANSITRNGREAPINEVGLFVKNPTANADPRPILVAYRTFSNIVKTNDFSLVFRWTINF